LTITEFSCLFSLNALSVSVWSVGIFAICQINGTEKVQKFMSDLGIKIQLPAESLVVDDSSLLLKFLILTLPETKSN